jgi:plastocyanin
MKKILFFLIILSSAVIIGVVALFFFQEQKGEEQVQLTPPKEATIAPVNQAQVEILKGSFSPTTLRIAKGDIVVWTNKDTSPHQIASDPYPSNDTVPGLLSDSLAANESFSFTFDKTGTFTYHDNLNPLKLKGTVVVE